MTNTHSFTHIDQDYRDCVDHTMMSLLGVQDTIFLINLIYVAWCGKIRHLKILLGAGPLCFYGMYLIGDCSIEIKIKAILTKHTRPLDNPASRHSMFSLYHDMVFDHKHTI
jgi:hypothetical protein